MSAAPVSPTWVFSDDFRDGVTGYLEAIEAPGSQQYDFGIKGRLRQIFEGDYRQLGTLYNFGAYHRGAVNGDYIITNTTVGRARGQVGRVEVQWESLAGQLPFDEFSITPQEQNPRVERNPAFAVLTQDDFLNVQTAANGLDEHARATARNKFAASPNAGLCGKLFNLLANGTENYILSVPLYSWSSYYSAASAPVPSAGGFVQTPGGPATDLLPTGYSWLRRADVLALANYTPLGGAVKVTRSWLGGPVGNDGGGYWDPILYPS